LVESLTTGLPCWETIGEFFGNENGEAKESWKNKKLG
jgi:hypothetical protein